MAAWNKYQDYQEQLHKGVHQWHAAGHEYRVALTNRAPVPATDAVFATAVEIATANGYPAGGVDIQNDLSETGGVATITAVDVVITAAGGAVGPFRYAFVYNNTQTTPAKPLAGYYDYGSAITLQDTETLTIDFGASLFTST